MSMLSKQVKELRELANSKELEMHEPITYGFYWKIKSKLFRAADTIEALSAKLQAANMENGGGWISCEDRLPENISTVIVQVKEIEKPTFGWYSNMENKWILSEKDFVNLEEFSVMAWQPLPEPYRP